MQDKIEQWAAVNPSGFCGLYEISSLGRLKRIESQRILKNRMDEKGYPIVHVGNNGEKRKFRIHTLVAIAFIGPRPDGKEVNHKNFNKADPRPENLEYVTKSENVLHAYTFPQRLAACPRGVNHANHKLNNEKVAEIKKLLRIGVKQRDIAAQFGVSHNAIGYINRGKTWAYIQ